MNNQQSKMLIVSADDYGCDEKTTDRILTSYTRKRIHCASAMTFMADSERAADLAKENKLPVGLHLNLDDEITGSQLPGKLREYHCIIAAYLNARKWNKLIYNPFLRNSFDYVFQAQWNEFCRLYEEEPKRLDGHHHMHLCLNMLLSGKIPKGIRIRRNLTFYSGEKNLINRLYRALVDWWLQRNFICTDAFFSMTPILKQGLYIQEKFRWPIMLSASSTVEILFHPGIENEYIFLMGPEWEKLFLLKNQG